MRRISSSATLFLKIFIPTFWIVFFGSFTLAVLISGKNISPLVSQPGFKIGIVIFYLTGVYALGISLFRLQRVELDSEHMYVTNYFKTYRYPLEHIDKIKELELIIFKLGIIHLIGAGSLGKKIFFVESRQKFEDYVKSSPELGEKVVQNRE